MFYKKTCFKIEFCCCQSHCLMKTEHCTCFLTSIFTSKKRSLVNRILNHFQKFQASQNYFQHLSLVEKGHTTVDREEFMLFIILSSVPVRISPRHVHKRLFCDSSKDTNTRIYCLPSLFKSSPTYKFLP